MKLITIEIVNSEDNEAIITLENGNELTEKFNSNNPALNAVADVVNSLVGNRYFDLFTEVPTTVKSIVLHTTKELQAPQQYVKYPVGLDIIEELQVDTDFVAFFNNLIANYND